MVRERARQGKGEGDVVLSLGILVEEEEDMLGYVLKRNVRM